MSIWQKILWIVFSKPVAKFRGEVTSLEVKEDWGLYVGLKNGEVWLLPDKDAPIEIKDGVAYDRTHKQE